jgi:5'-nucleotidase
MKKLILITNDDGVSAAGIRALTSSMRTLGEVYVFAPDGPRSGMSGAITATIPITCELLEREEVLSIYSCTGTPVDCVKLAICSILPRRPDLILSGINHGGNEAICVHYSGTMGAVIEGSICGVPSLGISLVDYADGADFSESCRLGLIVAKRMLEKGLPEGTYLNLNIPNLSQVKGIAVSRQANGCWVNEFESLKSPDGRPFYWLTGEFVDRGPVYPDSDVCRLNAGYASLVPGLFDVTDYSFMKELKTWKLD